MTISHLDLSVTLRKDHPTMEVMFNSIAHKYDLINRIGSFGLDAFWRRRLVNELKKHQPHNVLDLACGTGALSWLIYRKLKVQVTGLDLSLLMLEIAKTRPRSFLHQADLPNSTPPLFLKGCAEYLPFEGHSFDAVTIAFGIRNFNNPQKALQESFRVLKPGGLLLILDFASPKNRIWKFFFHIYFRFILPLFGRIVSNNKNAYLYLPQSVSKFPQYHIFCNLISQCGFVDVYHRPFTGGVAVLYSGLSPK